MQLAISSTEVFVSIRASRRLFSEILFQGFDRYIYSERRMEDITEANFQFGPIGSRESWNDVSVLELRRRQRAVDGVGGQGKPMPVVHIDLDQDRQDLLNVFNDRLVQGEISERVFSLTEEIILQVNSANYSVWQWRWCCFLHFLGEQDSVEGKEQLVLKELSLMQIVATENPKNYQLWNHRRKVAVERGEPHLRDELDFASACLEHDAKNYHAWAHRQFLVQKYASPSIILFELEFTRKCLERDVMNNSAWNQRAFLRKVCGGFSSDDLKKVWKEKDEVMFVVLKIQADQENEAAWAYMKHICLSEPGDGKFAIEQFTKTIMFVLEADSNNVAASSALIEYYKHRSKMSLGIEREHLQSIITSIKEKLETLDPLGKSRYKDSTQ